MSSLVFKFPSGKAVLRLLLRCLNPLRFAKRLLTLLAARLAKCLFALCVALAVFGRVEVHAGANNSTWNGGGTNGNWNTAANWGGTAPVGNNTLLFGGTARLTNTNNLTGAALTNQAIYFLATAGAFNLNGTNLRLTDALAVTICFDQCADDQSRSDLQHRRHCDRGKQQ